MEQISQIWLTKIIVWSQENKAKVKEFRLLLYTVGMIGILIFSNFTNSTDQLYAEFLTTITPHCTCNRGVSQLLTIEIHLNFYEVRVLSKCFLTIRWLCRILMLRQLPTIVPWIWWSRTWKWSRQIPTKCLKVAVMCNLEAILTKIFQILSQLLFKNSLDKSIKTMTSCHIRKMEILLV